MDTVFISYSHLDEDWKDRVQSHLSVLEKHGKLSIWDDRQIPLGGDWLGDIEQSLEQASIALLLVSRHFLNSDFIRNKEVPKLLRRREQNGLKVIPVMLSPCSWGHVDWLSEIQGYPKDNKPLSGLTEHQVDEALANLASNLPESSINLNEVSASEIQAISQSTEPQSIVINNFSGITLEQHEEGLVRQEKRLYQKFRELHGQHNPDQEKLLKLELDGVHNRLLNLQSSHEEALSRRKEADDALEHLQNELPELQIEKARELLAKNETQPAKQAFNDIVDKGAPSMALAAYESGKLEEEDINYAQAMKRYRIAVTLKDDDPDYLSAAGLMAYILGDYSSAIHWLENLLKIHLESDDYSDLELASVQDSLGEVYEAVCNHAKAESLFQDSLAIKEASLGKNDPSVATTLNNLASLYRAKGKYTKAELLYKRSLNILEKTYNQNHAAIVALLNNLAQIYMIQGEFSKANPLLQRCITISEKRYGENHPTIATLLNNLAGFYEKLGIYSDHYAKIEPLYQRSLIISESYLGEDHPAVASTLCNLAEFYRKKDEYAKAEPLYQRSLMIQEKSFGTSHSAIATTLNNLALLYQAQGEYAKAKPLYQRDIVISETLLGKNHPEVATTLRNLAGLYMY